MPRKVKLSKKTWFQARRHGSTKANWQRAKKISKSVKKYYKTIETAVKGVWRTMFVRSYYLKFPEEIKVSRDYPEGWHTLRKVVAENRAWINQTFKPSKFELKRVLKLLEKKVLTKEKKVIKEIKKRFFMDKYVSLIIEGQEHAEELGSNDLKPFEIFNFIHSKVIYFKAETYEGE